MQFSAWVLQLQLKTAGLRLMSRLSSSEGMVSWLSRSSSSVLFARVL